MTKFAWHVHHDTLFEALEPGGIPERQYYICTHKPPCEQTRRVALLKAIQGNVPAEVTEAWAEVDEYHQKYWASYGSGNAPAIECARLDMNRARRAYNLAVWKHRHAIDALHVTECPSCPWDGKTIFPALEEYTTPDTGPIAIEPFVPGKTIDEFAKHPYKCKGCSTYVTLGKDGLERRFDNSKIHSCGDVA